MFDKPTQLRFQSGYESVRDGGGTHRRPRFFRNFNKKTIGYVLMGVVVILTGACITALATRYVLEDIPYSLVAIRALAQVVGVPTPCIDAIITLGNVMLSDKMDEGRTAEALGIDGMSRDELLTYIRGE